MELRIFKVFILCVIVFDCVDGDDIDFTDCGSKYELKSVSMDGCKAIPCQVRIGGSYKIHMELKPTFKIEKFTQEVHVLVHNVYFELEVTPDDPCKTLACPVHVSDGRNFSSTLNIAKNLIPSKGQLQWRMKTESGVTAVCFQTSLLLVRNYRNYDFQKALVDQLSRNNSTKTEMGIS